MSMRFFLNMFLMLCIVELHAQTVKLRGLADTVGFAQTTKQMDAVMERITETQSGILKEKLKRAAVDDKTVWKTVIAPHDDYSYAGYLYPLVLQNVKAKTIILFGVAHKAKNFGSENQLIFDSYTHWRGPYGNVKVSAWRGEIMTQLPAGSFQVNDSLQTVEHSVEAEIPFLQYYNRKVEIISILVPYMNFEKMTELAKSLSKAIAALMQKNNLKWGEDIALVISADAVHYGDEDWGGKNFAFYGADTSGYKKAVEHEYEIMNTCMKGNLEPEKIKTFTDYTVQKDNFKDYKWTWCGRYSVPLGLLTSYYLCGELKQKQLAGNILGYATSLENKQIPVNDLNGMGVTAKATIRHWVGYPAIGFK